MDHAHDTEDDDDLDERLARVFEERGIPNPALRETVRTSVRSEATGGTSAARPTPLPASTSPAPPPKAATPPKADRPPKAPAAGVPSAPRGSRREKTMLLGLLGTLAGAFIGVLSMKLLVPRPPAGAGPDVHLDAVAGDAIDLVDPPALEVPVSPPAFQPDPFRSAGLPPAPPEAEPVDGDNASSSADHHAPSRFAADTALTDSPRSPSRFDALPRHDGLAVSSPPDLQPVPVAEPVSGAMPLDRTPEVRAASSVRGGPASPFGVLPASATVVAPAPDEGFRAVADGYVVREGDTWWSIAERAYGDGRFYKALFAWNRTIDPRTSLVPGTRLEVPDESRLQAAWGRLIPDSRPAPR